MGRIRVDVSIESWQEEISYENGAIIDDLGGLRIRAGAKRPAPGPGSIRQVLGSYCLSLDITEDAHFHMGSFNTQPEEWHHIACRFWETRDCYDGCIITPRIDTIAYAADDRIYLLKILNWNVLLTVSQITLPHP